MAEQIPETINLAQTSIVNVNMANVTKLNSSNYIMWSRQVHALLDGYGLAKHLDSSATIPDLQITVNDIAAPNPAFEAWNRQDRLIYSALIGAISLSVQSVVTRADTAADVWVTLAHTYAKPSRGHIKQLKHQLKNWTKGTHTIDDYVQGLTSRFDQLALLGKVIDHEDQVEYILGGLPDDYKSVVDQLEGRDIPPTLTELHEKLLNYEAKLLTVTSPSPYPITANYVNNRNRSSNNNKSTLNQHQSWTPNSQPRGFPPRTPRPYLGRCQICGVHGHSAKRCSHLHSMVSSGSNNQPLLPTPPYPPSPWLPRANIATMNQNGGNITPWILDSGATHHITSDLSNLALHQPYNGGEEVLIGDGSGLPISHTGSISLP
ncbi:Retrovirus-related Pol polyprotein from transposon RE1 [Cardamine amara subsp. amara]|uniref:Retrovirus-related Pol polyprotein from transposon RE1 n=1 Tax=Cardamine amara subsp. amara TaxID=228776 RepID=A0ABD1BS66_CARAN